MMFFKLLRRERDLERIGEYREILPLSSGVAPRIDAEREKEKKERKNWDDGGPVWMVWCGPHKNIQWVLAAAPPPTRARAHSKTQV